MRLVNFKYIDNNRFEKGINISFESNIKRVDNKWMQFGSENLNRFVILLGKNSSGKSSIITILEAYMKHNALLFSGTVINTQRFSIANGNFSYNSPIKKQTKEEKNIINIFGDSPRFSVSYEINGEYYLHKLIVQKSYGGFKKVENFYKIDKEGKILSEEDIHILKYSEDAFNLQTKIREYIQNFSYMKDKQELDRKQLDIVFKDQTKFQTLFSFIKVADPTVVDIEYVGNANIGTPDFVFHQERKNGMTKLHFDQLSTGTRKIINIVLTVLSDSSPKFLFIDEIENFLNKKLVIEMIYNIVKINKNIQMVMTSHSPWVFDKHFRYDAIYEVSNNKGVTTIQRYSEHYKIRSDKNISNFYANNHLTDPGMIDLEFDE